MSNHLKSMSTQIIAGVLLGFVLGLQLYMINGRKASSPPLKGDILTECVGPITDGFQCQCGGIMQTGVCEGTTCHCTCNSPLLTCTNNTDASTYCCGPDFVCDDNGGCKDPPPPPPSSSSSTTPAQCNVLLDQECTINATGVTYCCLLTQQCDNIGGCIDPDPCSSTPSVPSVGVL